MKPKNTYLSCASPVSFSAISASFCKSIYDFLHYINESKKTINTSYIKWVEEHFNVNLINILLTFLEVINLILHIFSEINLGTEK